MSGLAFFVAAGAAFAFNVSGLLTEVPLFREVSTPSGNVMENITSRCTINGPGALCSAVGFSSVDGKYWFDDTKTNPSGGLDRTAVFQQTAP